MENNLKIFDLKKNFKHNFVLKNITCELKSGVYGLLGPNGAGKTTLMRCITGLYHYQGKILLNESKIDNRNGYEIGYLPQHFGLFPELTVYEMLNYMCNIQRVEKKKRSDIIAQCLNQVNLTDKRNVKIRKLSGGMIRRVGIAQTLLSNPKVIIFDEPTAGLDPEERMRFKEIISNLNRDKIIIISTHIVEDVEACCDHIIVIDQGRIIKIGTVQEIENVAKHRVKEVDKTDDKNILYVEKSYLKNGLKRYRVLCRNEETDYVDATVEDGYLWLLKEK